MAIPQPYLVEQTIKQQVTINAGITQKVSVDIPKGTKAALKGYGYSWYASNTYILCTGNVTFPSRTDQEGSASIPRIFETSYPIRESGSVYLEITNGDSAAHTYDVVFYFYTTVFIPQLSTGGALTIETSSSSGTGNNVAIFDSSFGTSAGVTAKGLQVQDNAPATLLANTSSITSGTAAAIASTTALKKGVLVEADAANTDYVAIGNSTAQPFKLYAGDAVFIDIDDIAKVFVKKNVTNVTINYLAS